MLVDPHWSEYALTREFEQGKYIFKEGDPSDELYVIIEGQVAIIKGADTPTPLVLNYRGKDELIGEVSLLGDATRTASVLAVEPTTLLAINRRDFWALFDNKPTFREMIVRTLTERLLAADDSRLQAAASERDLFERLSSLAGENERLAEVVQLRQETMRFIVHDLRNPLNLVMMALGLIESDPDYAKTAETRHVLTMALSGVRRMFALIESLLDVDRLEDGGAALNLQPVDLRQVVDEVAEQYQPLARASRIEMTVQHLGDDLPLLEADRERLVRVVTNLVDNALKFTPAGKSLSITTWHEGDEVLAAIMDRGPGIPPEQRARVFDRFVQIGEQHDSARGFGLGLAYCRSAINAHGGRIWIEEGTEGIGSRFVFSLPIERPNGAQ